MQTLQKILPKYTVVLGIVFLVTVIYLVTRGNTVAVEVSTVRKMELTEAIYATGYVDADAMADLRSEISATVSLIGAYEGEWLEKGSTVLAFDDRRLHLAVEEAEAAYAEQKAKSDDLQVKLKRSHNLFNAGAVSVQDLDDAEREYTLAKRKLQQRDVQLKSRRDDLKKQQVNAPLAGVLALLDAKVGDYIVANTLVARIIDTNSYVINVEVDELDVPRLKKSQVATVALDALPEERFSAVVSRIVPETDRITKTSKVYLELDEPVEGLQVGMTATANIVYNVRKGALLVPKSSVLEQMRQDYVWKVEKGKLQKQAITSGAEDSRFVEVLDGLVQGDSVVVKPEEKFRQGMEAKVIKNADG
jgi:RND family efflux transporter MFP subunit